MKCALRTDPSNSETYTCFISSLKCNIYNSMLVIPNIKDSRLNNKAKEIETKMLKHYMKLYSLAKSNPNYHVEDITKMINNINQIINLS